MSTYGTWAPIHLWSIAIEFQFYLISPCLILLMNYTSYPWIVPLVAYIISASIGSLALVKLCSSVDYMLLECP